MAFEQQPDEAEALIRVWQPGDSVAIAEIFTEAIHQIASRDYTLEQCLAWSERKPNPDHWRWRCELKRPFVAVVQGEIAGFLELDPDGHIDCAYINPRYQRRGIMSQLVRHAVVVCEHCRLLRVYVEASKTARPMFEKLGFQLIRENLVTIREVSLINFHMERILPGIAS